MLELFTRVGARVPLYATGVGKVSLAGMTEENILAYLERVWRSRCTPITLVAEDALRADLTKTCMHGYGVDNEEMEEGIRCVAAPIFHHNGDVAAVLSIPGAAIRSPPDRLEEMGRIVRYRALAVSRTLGFDP